jgi:hypothetical protein
MRAVLSGEARRALEVMRMPIKPESVGVFTPTDEVVAIKYALLD